MPAAQVLGTSAMLRSSTKPDTTNTPHSNSSAYPSTKSNGTGKTSHLPASRTSSNTTANAAKPNKPHKRASEADSEKLSIHTPTSTFETRPTTIRFDLPDGPNNAGTPRIIVHPASQAEELLQTVSRKLEVEEKRGVRPYIPTSVHHVMGENRQQWKSDCVEQRKPFRRDSLSGLTMIKCPRSANKSKGGKMKGWVVERCCLSTLVV